MLFKIPKEVFEKFDEYKSNGQSALLQEIKSILEEKYSTTDKISGWGKVVLIKFSDGKHNIEILPAYELDNKTFSIPNSENSGSWEKFDPRTEIKKFKKSDNKTNSLTSDLIRMIKAWKRNITTVDYKSYQLTIDVINYLNNEFTNGATYNQYHNVVKNFFDSLKNICSNDIKSNVKTAYKHAVKAIEFMDDDKPKEASEEWIKIFGSKFPKVSKNPDNKSKDSSRTFFKPSSPWS